MEIIAKSMPAIRREIVDNLSTYGVQHYLDMIVAGKQLVGMPVGGWKNPEDAAERLAFCEHQRMSTADLWFVSSEMTGLVRGAFEAMPSFAPVKSDLPSQCGFVLYEDPIVERQVADTETVRRDVERLLITDCASAIGMGTTQVRGILEKHSNDFESCMRDIIDRCRDLGVRRSIQEIFENRHIIDEHISIVTGRKFNLHGASWGPALTRSGEECVWFSFYCKSNIGDMIIDPEELRRARMIASEFVVDNEAIIKWFDPATDDPNEMMHMDSETTYHWAALVLATFRLAASRGLSDTLVERTPRAERRRSERAKIKPKDVNVVRLRSSAHREPSSGSGGDREYSCRWAVRGHWRQQHYPTLGEALDPAGERNVASHRPIWILPHLKGPDDKPLRGGERVNLI